MKIGQQDFTVYYSYECPYVEYGVKKNYQIMLKKII